MKIPVSTPDITPEDVGAVAECAASGWVSGISPYVERFEKEFADYIGVKHGVATGSGTTALHLAMASLKLPRGSEVVMPSFTMIASANACSYLGLKPVFVDIEPDTWCMDTSKLVNKITSKTKAIMPVHIYGHPCNMGAIRDIALDHDLYIIEDAAESHGATWKNKKTGSLGDLGCFSFYANKIITTGEGGMITTDDDDLAETCRWLRAHAFGREGRHYWHEDVGYGYRMGGLQAALGSSQLKRVNYYVQKRQMNAWYYMHQLEHLRERGLVVYPVQRREASNVYWMFSVLLTDEAKISRDYLVKALEGFGIETRTFFYPLHVQPPYKTDDTLPVTMDIYPRGINLPSGNQLTKQQIEAVCSTIGDLLG